MSMSKPSLSTEVHELILSDTENARRDRGGGKSPILQVSSVGNIIFSLQSFDCCMFFKYRYQWPQSPGTEGDHLREGPSSCFSGKRTFLSAFWSQLFKERISRYAADKSYWLEPILLVG